MSEESPTLAPTPIMDAAWRKFRPEKNSYSTDKLRKAGAAIERELAAVTAERDAMIEALCSAENVIGTLGDARAEIVEVTRIVSAALRRP